MVRYAFHLIFPLLLLTSFARYMYHFITLNPNFQLLKNDPKRRLGYDDISALKAHPFFNDIDWELIASKRIQPPYSLALESDEDVRAFDPKFTSMASQFTPAADPEFATSNYFQGFTFSGN